MKIKGNKDIKSAKVSKEFYTKNALFVVFPPDGG